MNKKQLAKLLIKHPEIKALYESRSFDASIINKVIAEEIVKEQDDEEGEGRVSKADKQARAELDAEDSVFNLDPSLSDAEIRKQFRAALKSAATLEQIGALGKEASEILDPKYARTLEKDIKAAKARIEGGSTNDSKEDPVKKELIQSMKSEIEFLKSLLNDPKTMPLDKEEYKEAIDEYIEKLEKMGVTVAKTDSIEDDKAFVQSIQDKKPEIEKAADAVKAAEEDDFAEKFSDLDAAIMAALKGSKDAATAANDELDLSDIEIEDDESDNPAGSGFRIDNSSSPELTRDSYDNQIIGMKDAIPEEDKKQFIKNLKSESPNPAIERILGFNKSYLEMFNDQQHVENILKVFEPDQQMELPADNEQPATEEGTAAAIEAIVGEVPAEVANIKPADVQAAEEELKSEIEEDPQKEARAEELTKKVEKKKMGTDDNRSLSNKIHKLKNGKRFDEIVKIIEILGKANSTLGELQSVWPTAKDYRLQGYKAALSNLPEGVRTAIAKANEAMNSNPESEEAQQVVTAAAAEVEKAITTFEEKIEKFRNTSAKKLAAKSGKQAGDYTSMKVMQNPYFAMFLAQQLAKANLSESILREEANFDTDLLQKAINDNKEEVGIIATDSGLDLATAIKEKFGIDIQSQPKDTSMKDVANEIKTKYEEKMGSDKGLKKFLNDLFVSNKNEDGTFDLEAVKAEADRQLNLDNADGQDSGEDSGIESGEADEIIATTLQSLNSDVEAFPELLANDQFKSLLAMTLRNSNSDSSQSSDNTADSDEELVDADSNSTMQESLSGIYLTEEDPAPPIQSDEEENLPPKTQSDEETGSTMSTDEASGLFNEIQEMQKLFDGQENLKIINVMDLAKKAFGEIPEAGEVETKTAEQAAEDGNTASGIDARKEQASAIEIYSALIQPMDDFFSTDQAQRLGFMEQFLLESQSKMLWNLIGNLTLIAEKGKAKAFTNRAEKEAARLSGDGAPEAEVEQTAEPEVQAEGFNPFKRDKEPVEISKEDQISLKTDLKALLQTLRATKSMIGSYERNMTKVSVDPGLDGSALKEQLDQYLPMVQKSIAKIVERANEAFIKATELNAPKEEPEVSQPADDANQKEMDQNEMVEAILEAIAPALDGMHGLQEENGRDETINFVDGIYNEMRAIYAPVGGGEDSEGLRGFMETGDRAQTIEQAEKMLELATKEDFIKLFPGGRIGEGGMPATVNAATETMNREIKKLVLIMRDVVTLASKSIIPHSKLVEIVNSLTTISKSLYNSFGAKMMISGESLAQIETRLGEDESNKSLTDQETKPGIMDKLGNLAGKAGELAGKGLEKLKQMFGWLSEESLKLLAKLIDTPDIAKDPMFIKFVEPFGELVVKQGGELTAKSEGSPEVKQVEELMVKTLESKSWFDSLKPEQQSAVTEMINILYTKRNLLQEMEMGIVPSEVKDKISPDYQMAMVLALKGMSEDQKETITSLMQNQADDFVSYLVSQHELRRKLGEEKAKQIGDLVLKTTDSSKRSASNKPTPPEGSAPTVTQGDQDPNVEDGMPEPENLGKDNSELEDVDGFDDSKEEPDISGSPEDEDDVEDFKREVKSLDSFLPLVQKPTDPIAKKIQPIKDSFTSTLAKKKILQGPRAKELFNKFFLLIFKQMNKDLVMEDAERFAKTLIPKIKQDMKKFVTSLGSDELKPRDFNFFFNNIKEVDLTNLIAIIRKHKAQIAKIVYGEKGQVTQDNSEKAVRGKEVTLQEALKPIIEKMLNEHYNH